MLRRMKGRVGLSREYVFPVLLFSLAVMYVVAGAMRANPDADAFFLIKGGEYLVRNAAVPRVNPWHILPDLGYIMQQPLCSILNYCAYSRLGLEGMWLLAIAEAVIMYYAVWRFTGLFTLNTYRRLIVLDVFMVLSVQLNLVVTRPYPITIALNFLTIGLLYASPPRKDVRSAFTAALRIAPVVVLQANFQMAFIVMHFLWFLCFIFPDVFSIPYKSGVSCALGWFKSEVIRFGARGLCSYPVLCVAALLNPYGLRGSLYMVLSSEALSLCQNYIREIKPPFLVSPQTFFIVLLLAGLCFLFHTRKLSSALLYQALGVCVLASLTFRACWLLLPPLITVACLLPVTEADESCHRLVCLRLLPFLCAAAALCYGIFYFDTAAVVRTKYPFHTCEFLVNNADRDARIYTHFNAGAGIAFFDFKVYMDARPEIYTEAICGRDIISEWIEVYTDASLVEDFIDRYEFEYLAAYPGSVIELYLRWHEGEYRLVAEDAGFCKLYVRCSDS